MSIKILSESEIKEGAKSYQAPALLFSNPKNLYQRRAKRLRELATEHPLADYLLFAAEVVESQLNVLTQHPIAQDPQLQNIQDTIPLNAKTFAKSGEWLELFKALLVEIKPKASDLVLATIENLEKTSDKELTELADRLLNEEFNLVSSDQAVFIWAALSLYWLQLVQQIPHHSHLESNENLHYCPVCGSAPVSSVVHFGSSQGLRYLHCSLCESEWNVVRAQCTNCNQFGKLSMWSFNQELAAVTAESCEDCGSYLKILFQDKDANVEAVADDLASIYLDVELEQKDLARSGLNPFMFPAQEV
ncbi:formate dehydrogenase accessory protein FdhE [Pasteurella bettyae]|uniref:formate dehydrogenase accessory protein FdhE n=1 Tax=Pasteurella bettyae TaxID=752 RepID=UPI003D2E8161